MESRLPGPRGRPKPAALVIMNTETDPGPNRHKDPGSGLPGWLCELIASSGFSFKRFKMAQNFHVNKSSKEPRVRAAHTSPATGRAGPQPPKHPGLADHVVGPEMRGGWGSPGALRRQPVRAEKGAASVRKCSQDSVRCVPPRPFRGLLKHSRGLTVSSPTNYRSPYIQTSSLLRAHS